VRSRSYSAVTVKSALKVRPSTPAPVSSPWRRKIKGNHWKRHREKTTNAGEVNIKGRISLTKQEIFCFEGGDKG
jgi:hypothetical protein